MEDITNYAFDDEVVAKFCYDGLHRKIKVYFEGYVDVVNRKRVDRYCVWTLEKWTSARSRVTGSPRFESLELNLGIFDLILTLEQNEELLRLIVNMLDGQYVELLFEQPITSLKAF